MKYGKIILALAAGFAAVKLFCKRKDTGEISLANIRRGIKNGWYSAQLLDMDDKYYVQLSGKRTDGSEEQGVYEISKATFDALKTDGVPQLV